MNNIATIRIDDGKRNALSPAVLREIYQALDQAESVRAAISRSLPMKWPSA
jgi:enoyl-CoA hydratase/carnithine racemase